MLKLISLQGFLNLSADAVRKIETGLEKAGLVWHINPAATLAVVDFEYVARYFAENAPKGVSGQIAASFTLKTTDTRGKTASTTFKFMYK